MNNYERGQEEFERQVAAFAKGMLDRLVYPKEWKKKFAYLPVELECGRIWLKTYYQRINCREDGYGNRYEIIENGTIFDVLKGDD